MIKITVYRAKGSGAWLCLAVSFATALCGASPAFARERGDPMTASTTKQGYAFMSGGVGIDERNQMMKKARLYDLELSFADQSGKYLSDVQVVINDERGHEIVNTTTNGPWFYMNLPTGKYDVKATVDNQTREINGLKISKDHAEVRLLHWNVADQRISRK